MRKNETIGFLGVGAIAEAMIIGLLDHAGHTGPLLLTERSSERSQRLCSSYPNVQRVADPQAVVDGAPLVVVGVLPEQCEPLLRSLRFAPTQTILSLVSDVSIAQLAASVAPATSIFRAIPMPPVELGKGPIVYFPFDNNMNEFLGGIGEAIVPRDEQQFVAFSAACSVMATYYELQASMANWMASMDIDEHAAARFSTSLFEALSAIAVKQPERLGELADESTTAGGLNEQMLNENRESRWFEMVSERFDAIARRLGILP